jgi:hypothetical protein
VDETGCSAASGAAVTFVIVIVRGASSRSSAFS